MSAGWALQQGVFALLAADSRIQSLAGARIFDAVPRRSDFPYIVLGEAEETAAGTATDQASEHTFSVTVWSRAGGMGESKRIASAVCAALDRSEPALEGHKLIDLRFVTADYARQSDGETHCALLRFKAMTEPQ